MNLPVTLALLGLFGLAQSCNPEAGATNVAINGEMSQSSNILLEAKPAIDGVDNTLSANNSCDNDAWWKLDLKQSYRIAKVVLTNRSGCCLERLLGAEVRIGDSPDNKNPVCGTVTSVTDRTIPFCCYGMEGRYVSVAIPCRIVDMSLCEVEVYSIFENRVCW